MKVFLFLAIICSLLSCATDSSKEKPTKKNQEVLLYSEKNFSDPLEGFNRGMFWFNDKLYRYALSPLSSGYHSITPTPIKKGLSNFFQNLREPLYSILHLFQGEVTSSGKNLGRFVINSTIGLLGFIDVSSHTFEMEKDPTSLGETLASYNVGAGPFIVLPILGPSDLRGTVSMGADFYGYPLRHVPGDQYESEILWLEGAHTASYRLKDYNKVVSDKEDPYTFIRNMYLQNRERNRIYQVNNDE